MFNLLQQWARDNEVVTFLMGKKVTLYSCCQKIQLLQSLYVRPQGFEVRESEQPPVLVQYGGNHDQHCNKEGGR
jgi:hypothetical protein